MIICLNSSSSLAVVSNRAKTLPVKSTQCGSPQPHSYSWHAEERALHGLLPPWPLIAACAERGLPSLLLTSFVSEGDNLPDAAALATHLMELLAADPAVAPTLAKAAGAAVAGVAVAAEGGGVAAGAAAATGGEAMTGLPTLRMPCSFASLYGGRPGQGMEY